MDVSVIIITHNRCDILADNLRHCARFRKLFYELLVIDNASEDQTEKILEGQFKWVRTITLPENMGISFSRNVGAVNSKGNLLLFLDDDGRFDFSALGTMIEKFEKEHDLGVISGRVVDLPACDVFGIGFENYRVSVPMYRQSHQFHGGNSLIRKSAFVESGMLPPFFFGAEERDITLRMFKCGYRVMAYDGAVMLHRKQIDPGALRRYHSYHYRNCLLLIWRNLPVENAVTATILNLGAGLVSSLLSGTFGPWIKGVLRGLFDLPKTIINERNPLSRRQYKLFKFACREELNLQKKMKGFWRNLGILTGSPVRAKYDV